MCVSNNNKCTQTEDDDRINYRFVRTTGQQAINEHWTDPNDRSGVVASVCLLPCFTNMLILRPPNKQCSPPHTQLLANHWAGLTSMGANYSLLTLSISSRTMDNNLTFFRSVKLTVTTIHNYILGQPVSMDENNKFLWQAYLLTFKFNYRTFYLTLRTYKSGPHPHEVPFWGNSRSQK